MFMKAPFGGALVVGSQSIAYVKRGVTNSIEIAQSDIKVRSTLSRLRILMFNCSHTELWTETELGIFLGIITGICSYWLLFMIRTQ